MIVRVSVLVVAAVAIAWLAIWLHDARVFAHAQRVAAAARTPAMLERAAGLFADASAHTPDTLPESGRGYVLGAAGRYGQGIALLRDVTRREPRNAAAWELLSITAARVDPQLAARARARALRLASLPSGR